MIHHRVPETPDDIGYNMTVKCRICYKDERIISRCEDPLAHYESEVLNVQT